jgi:hypothetical protein
LVLLGGENWKRHRNWCLFVIAATVAALLWAVAVMRRNSAWPGGSSVPGFTFGLIGGGIIVFEVLLWFRKQVRAWRIGRAQAWLRAHIWLGLLSFPLLVLHSGFHLGGSLSTVLMVLLVIVVLSGIWGLVLQQWLPTYMLDQVSAETIYSQIDQLSRQLLHEARRLVDVICGTMDAAGIEREPEEAGEHLIVGAVRTAGRVRGKVLETRTAPEPILGCEPLRDFFMTQVAPFLEQGNRSLSILRWPGGASEAFADLAGRLPKAAHETVATLEDFCSQKRQWEQQARLHFWLHNWLWLHFPLSLALLVLMFVHAWAAVKFW